MCADRFAFDRWGQRFKVLHMYDRNCNETTDPKLAESLVAEMDDNTYALDARNVGIHTVQ